jgi:hypothetical protein
MHTYIHIYIHLYRHTYTYIDIYTPMYIIHINYIQGDSGGICTTLGDDSMSDSKQKSSYEHGSDF